MKKRNTTRDMLDLGLMEIDPYIIPAVAHAWVKLGLPDVPTMPLPVPILLELYPNIVRFGPKGDAIMEFIDKLVTVIQAYPNELVVKLVRQAKVFSSLEAEHFFHQVDGLERQQFLSLEECVNREEHAALVEEGLAVQSLRGRLATLARYVSTSYAYVKNISLNDADAIEMKRAIELHLWILVVGSGTQPGLARYAAGLYRTVNDYVTRVAQTEALLKV